MVDPLKVGALSAVVLMGLALDASAATCPDPVQTGDRTISITIDTGTATCLAWGPGNINGSTTNDGFLDGVGAGFTTLDKNDVATFPFPDAITLTSGQGTTSGTFTIQLPTGWEDFAFGVKVGGSTYDPDWAVFSLSALGGQFVTGTITVVNPVEAGGGGGISHLNLYGKISVIPLPAGIVLLFSALAGLAFWSRSVTKAT